MDLKYWNMIPKHQKFVLFDVNFVLSVVKRMLLEISVNELKPISSRIGKPHFILSCIEIIILVHHRIFFIALPVKLIDFLMQLLNFYQILVKMPLLVYGNLLKYHLIGHDSKIQ